NRRSHHVHRPQRARCDEATHLLGDEHKVEEPVLGQRAATVLLADQHRRPAELGGLLPVRRCVPSRRRLEGPDGGDRGLGGEELAGRLQEELLVLAQLELQLPRPLRRLWPFRRRSVKSSNSDVTSAPGGARMPSRQLSFPTFDADNHMYETREALTK